MREKYEAMGNEMIRNLGFENKKVILFWKAFEEERWLACELHYNCFKKGLTKQSTLGIIIIESEREVRIMRIYIFETINGIVIRKAAKSTDEAIAWFKGTYPTRAFSCVYEQQTQERQIKKVLTR